MKKWILAAIALVLIGCIIVGGVMIMLKWDFTKLSTTRYETRNYEVAEDFNGISIRTNTADVVFERSEDGKCLVVCHEPQNETHTVAVRDETLKIDVTDSRRWYEYIGINFEMPRITVYLPKTAYDALSVKESTGRIRIGNITVGALDLSTTTGGIELSNVSCTGDANLHVSTGETKLTDVKCGNLASVGSTGDIILSKVIAEGTLSIKRSTGDVKFDACDAAEIFVKTNTGVVKGTLLSAKTFHAKTNTGRVKVPESITGGKCEITTNTGNIKIEIQ